MRSSSIANAILALLEGQHTHLTASEVYDALHITYSAINRSTIYRALKRLVDAGEVSISDIGRESQVYELSSANPHHHLVCQSCHRILTLEDGIVREFFREIESQNGFGIATHHLILYGVCDQCRQKKDPA